MPEARPQEPPRQRNPTLSLEELNRIVLEFLNKKGYARTEAMLRLESARQPTPSTSAENVQTGTIAMPPAMTGPEAYSRVYFALRDWVSSSLDLYQPELSRVLYPVFVHLYLELLSNGHEDSAKELFSTFATDHRVLHNAEIDNFAGLSLAQHVQENALAQSYMKNKYHVNVSRTSFDLLLYFLHSIEAMGGSVVIRVINQYIELAVTNSQPPPPQPSAWAGGAGADGAGADGGVPTAVPGDGLVGSELQAGANGSPDDFNAQPVKLGKLPLAEDFRNEVTAFLEQQDKEAGSDPASAGSLRSTFTEKVKPSTDSPAAETLPLPKYRPMDVDREILKITDAKARIPLGRQAALPSVAMYTFHNTHDELNALAFSEDSTLAAGGFADSYVQLWNLKGERLSGITKESKLSSSSRRLIGHSGAVYGLSFAPDGRTLLSASEDKTVRLWSMDTYSALVSYKGHAEPVWDVAYGPFGHYFATASHDQTARLWSTDHIYPLRIFAGHMSDVDVVTFHPNGTYLFTGSSDRTVRMWDVSQGASVRVFIGHTGALTSMAVSPDGHWLATGGDDGNVFLWDIGSGKRLKVMRGHGRAGIYSLSWSQEGTVLVSGGGDNSVRVWDAKKNTPEAGSEPEALQAAGAAKVAPSAQRKGKEIQSTTDHMSVFFTKRTPVYKVQFTSRNLVLAGGAFLG